MSYVTGQTIRSLREKQNMTQKQLADALMISDKTISKWETDKGLPDISLIEPLAAKLRVSVAELLSGEMAENKNKSGNMKKTCFYVCPICQNVIASTGEGAFSCCGVTLPKLMVEENDSVHEIQVERVENDYYVVIEHPMEKTHYISFVAYVTSDRVQLVKLYPQQDAKLRFPVNGHGSIFAYCNRHGLFEKRI